MIWIYDLPQWLLCVLVILVYTATSLIGSQLLRPWVRRRANDQPGHNDIVGNFLSAGGVLYGLLLGLVAVGAWQNHSNAEAIVTREATRIAALYRDLTVYPEPHRRELVALLGEYVRFVIEDAWPAQQEGGVNTDGVPRIAAIFQRLSQFEPVTPSQVALHQEALRELNAFYEARRERLDAVNGGLPESIWYVLVVGSALMIGVTWLFFIPRRSMQLSLTLFLAVSMGLMVFLTVSMDHPFRGLTSVSPAPYAVVRDQLLQSLEAVE
jgi:hypothetical protein